MLTNEAKATDSTPVHVWMDKLVSEIATLSDTVERAYKRFDSVLHPPMPTNARAQETDGSTTPMSALAHSLRERASEVMRIRIQLSELLERVEL